MRTLWIVRIALALVATLIIAQAASFLVRSGAVMQLVHSANPEDSGRQLERSIAHAISERPAETYVIGRTEFIEKTTSHCGMGRTVVGIPIEDARWRDYYVAIDSIASLDPKQLILEARPYLWTTIRFTGWPAQKLGLLPRDGSPELFPLNDVRTFIRALGESAKPIAKKDPVLDDYQLIAVSYASETVEQVLKVVSSKVSRIGSDTMATFVEVENDKLSSALPTTATNIRETYSHSFDLKQIQLLSEERFKRHFRCDY